MYIFRKYSELLRYKPFKLSAFDLLHKQCLLRAFFKVTSNYSCHILVVEEKYKFGSMMWW